MATSSKPKAYELVIWIDPASEFEGWQRIDKMVATESVEVYSIGWPVREDETTLYLAMDFHDNEANTIGKIPLNAIKARKRVNLRGFPPKVKQEPVTIASVQDRTTITCTETDGTS
jgi:hypothetical protein